MTLRELRRVIVGQAKRTGLLSIVANSRWRRARLLILCYHGISIDDEHVWDPELFLAPELFRSRLEILREGRYQVLPLGEALERLWRGELPPRSVAITVDDGFHDFHAVAYPLLREFEYPSTVYLRTDYAEYQLPVFKLTIRYILWKTRERFFDGAIIGAAGPVNVDTVEGRSTASGLVEAFAREQALTPVAKHELARYLAENLGVDYARIERQRLFHLLSREECELLSPKLVDLQLHTHHHWMPTEREAFHGEIRDNRAALAALSADRARRVHFCYPSGAYQLRFLPWLTELGVVSATTGERGLASRASNPLLLPRLVDTTLLAPVEIEGWLAGFSAWLPHKRLPRHRRQEAPP